MNWTDDAGLWWIAAMGVSAVAYLLATWRDRARSSRAQTKPEPRLRRVG